MTSSFSISTDSSRLVSVSPLVLHHRLQGRHKHRGSRSSALCLMSTSGLVRY